MEETLKKLNSEGDDRNLSKNGNNRNYWYSIEDIMILLVHTRSRSLEYNDTQFQPGEEYLAIRQNKNRIFLSDPYYSANFEEYIKDDVSRIIGNHEVQKQNNYEWKDELPNLIVIPLLSGMHWRAIIIQVDYGNYKINIIWDDPYGKFQRDLKINLLEPIKINILKLFQRHNEINHNKQSNKLNVEQQENSIDQQGRGKNGWDCGPITLTNIRDYTNYYSKNGDFIDMSSTIPQHDRENHETILKYIRISHIDEYREIAKTDIDSNRRDNIRNSCKEDNGKKLNSQNSDLMKSISTLSDFHLQMFFSVLENYQRITLVEEG